MKPFTVLFVVHLQLEFTKRAEKDIHKTGRHSGFFCFHILWLELIVPIA
jgi:hypothetical protein